MTKILFLIAAALTFVMSGLVVAHTSNADRLLSEWKKEQMRAEQALQVANSNMIKGAADREQLQKSMGDLEARLIANDERVASLQRENTNLLAQVNQLAREKVSHAGQIDQFTAVMQVYADLNNAQSVELNGLRDKELNHTRREIDLTDRINDLTGQIEVAQETMRSLMEQNQGLREQMASGGSGGTTLASTGRALRAPRNFQARVTNVDLGSNGVTLVEIGAGANDQLQAGMQLNLIRGSEFIGKVILERVNPNQSVGRVDYIGMTVKAPRTSDIVRASSL